MLKLNGKTDTAFVRDMHRLIRFVILLMLAGVVDSHGDRKTSKFKIHHFDRFMFKSFHRVITRTGISCAIKCSKMTNCLGFNFDYQSYVCRLYEDFGESFTEVDIKIFLRIADCGPEPKSPYAVASTSKNSNPIGSRVNYTCVDGTYAIGREELKCLPSGVWDVPFINCSIAKTCHQAHQLGVNVLPTVQVKPDENQSAITVNCEMTGSDVYTVAGHDLANRTYVTGYEERRSFRIPINYTLPIKLLGSIADDSAECEQYVDFECSNSAFYVQGLVTRNGSVATYYAGGVKEKFNCACNINNTCLGGKKCNCDINDRLTRDYGYNRYKEDLPITAFLAGDTGSRQEYFYLTIGRMRCKG